MNYDIPDKVYNRFDSTDDWIQIIEHWNFGTRQIPDYESATMSDTATLAGAISTMLSGLAIALGITVHRNV